MAVSEGGSGLALERVLSPIAIGGVPVKNRVARTAHGASRGYGDLSDDLIACHVARAAPFGMRVFAQINPVGLYGGPAWQRPWSVSQAPVPMSPMQAHAMTHEVAALRPNATSPGFLPAAIVTGHAAARNL